jgi:dephospho-CoA kinase
MKTIGLVGGVASGKSAVADALARRGAIVFDADAIAHQVIAQRDIRDQLVARWGGGILAADGRIDRRAIAARVFGDSPENAAERRFLEELLHPRIRQRIEAEARQLPDGSAPAVVIDAPLLVEVGWNDVCDAVLCVDVPREMRLARAQASRGWTAEEFSRREAAQLPIEEKRRWCSHAVDNSGTLAQLDAQVDRFWRQVVGG